MIFNFHWYSNYTGLEFIKEQYIPFFKRCCRHALDVVIYGPKEDKDRGVFSNYLPENGWFSYKTLQMAYERNVGYDGYLFLNDDSFVNPIMFDQHNPDKILAEAVSRKPMNGSRWSWPHRRHNGSTFIERMKMAENDVCRGFGRDLHMCRTNVRHHWITMGRADMVYYPARYMPILVPFLKTCLEHSAFLEMCVPAFTANFPYVAVPNCHRPMYRHNSTHCGYNHPVKYGAKYADNRKRMKDVFEWIEKTRLFDSSILTPGSCLWTDAECAAH